MKHQHRKNRFQRLGAQKTTHDSHGNGTELNRSCESLWGYIRRSFSYQLMQLFETLATYNSRFILRDEIVPLHSFNRYTRDEDTMLRRESLL